MATEKEGPKATPSGSAFIGLCTMRNGEATLRWYGVTLWVGINLPSYATAAFRIIAFPGAVELVILSIGGLILAGIDLFLYHVLRRDGKHLRMWNDMLDELERLNGVEGGLKVFSSRRYRRLRSSRDRLQGRLQVAFICSIVVWVVIAIVAMAVLGLKLGGYLQ